LSGKGIVVSAPRKTRRKNLMPALRRHIRRTLIASSSFFITAGMPMLCGQVLTHAPQETRFTLRQMPQS
jgi:hypothetical protein